MKAFAVLIVILLASFGLNRETLASFQEKTEAAPNKPEAGPDSIAVGQVIELEFFSSHDWCQLTIRVTEGQVVAVTKDVRAQGLLELAAAKGQPVEIAYTAGSPNVLTRVKVGEGVKPR